MQRIGGVETPQIRVVHSDITSIQSNGREISFKPDKFDRQVIHIVDELAPSLADSIRISGFMQWKSPAKLPYAKLIGCKVQAAGHEDRMQLVVDEKLRVTDLQLSDGWQIIKTDADSSLANTQQRLLARGPSLLRSRDDAAGESPTTAEITVENYPATNATESWLRIDADGESLRAKCRLFYETNTPSTDPIILNVQRNWEIDSITTPDNSGDFGPAMDADRTESGWTVWPTVSDWRRSPVVVPLDKGPTEQANGSELLDLDYSQLNIAEASDTGDDTVDLKLPPDAKQESNLPADRNIADRNIADRDTGDRRNDRQDSAEPKAVGLKYQLAIDVSGHRRQSRSRDSFLEPTYMIRGVLPTNERFISLSPPPGRRWSASTFNEMAPTTTFTWPTQRRDFLGVDRAGVLGVTGAPIASPVMSWIDPGVQFDASCKYRLRYSDPNWIETFVIDVTSAGGQLQQIDVAVNGSDHASGNSIGVNDHATKSFDWNWSLVPHDRSTNVDSEKLRSHILPPDRITRRMVAGKTVWTIDAAPYDLRDYQIIGTRQHRYFFEHGKRIDLPIVDGASAQTSIGSLDFEIQPVDHSPSVKLLPGQSESGDAGGSGRRFQYDANDSAWIRIERVVSESPFSVIKELKTLTSATFAGPDQIHLSIDGLLTRPCIVKTPLNLRMIQSRRNGMVDTSVLAKPGEIFIPANDVSQHYQISYERAVSSSGWIRSCRIPDFSTDAIVLSNEHRLHCRDGGIIARSILMGNQWNQGILVAPGHGIWLISGSWGIAFGWLVASLTFAVSIGRMRRCMTGSIDDLSARENAGLIIFLLIAGGSVFLMWNWHRSVVAFLIIPWVLGRILGGRLSPSRFGPMDKRIKSDESIKGPDLAHHEITKTSIARDQPSGVQTSDGSDSISLESGLVSPDRTGSSIGAAAKRYLNLFVIVTVCASSTGIGAVELAMAQSQEFPSTVSDNAAGSKSSSIPVLIPIDRTGNVSGDVVYVPRTTADQISAELVSPSATNSGSPSEQQLSAGSKRPSGNLDSDDPAELARLRAGVRIPISSAFYSVTLADQKTVFDDRVQPIEAGDKPSSILESSFLNQPPPSKALTRSTAGEPSRPRLEAQISAIYSIPLSMLRNISDRNLRLQVAASNVQNIFLLGPTNSPLRFRNDPNNDQVFIQLSDILAVALDGTGNIDLQVESVVVVDRKSESLALTEADADSEKSLSPMSGARSPVKIPNFDSNRSSEIVGMGRISLSIPKVHISRLELNLPTSYQTVRIGTNGGAVYRENTKRRLAVMIGGTDQIDIRLSAPPSADVGEDQPLKRYYRITADPNCTSIRCKVVPGRSFLTGDTYRFVVRGGSFDSEAITLLSANWVLRGSEVYSSGRRLLSVVATKDKPGDIHLMWKPLSSETQRCVLPDVVAASLGENAPALIGYNAVGNVLIEPITDGPTESLSVDQFRALWDPADQAVSRVVVATSGLPEFKMSSTKDAPPRCLVEQTVIVHPNFTELSAMATIVFSSPVSQRLYFRIPQSMRIRKVMLNGVEAQPFRRSGQPDGCFGLGWVRPETNLKLEVVATTVDSSFQSGSSDGRQTKKANRLPSLHIENVGPTIERMVVKRHADVDVHVVDSDGKVRGTSVTRISDQNLRQRLIPIGTWTDAIESSSTRSSAQQYRLVRGDQTDSGKQLNLNSVTAKGANQIPQKQSILSIRPAADDSVTRRYIATLTLVGSGITQTQQSSSTSTRTAASPTEPARQTSGCIHSVIVPKRLIDSVAIEGNHPFILLDGYTPETKIVRWFDPNGNAIGSSSSAGPAGISVVVDQQDVPRFEVPQLSWISEEPIQQYIDIDAEIAGSPAANDRDGAGSGDWQTQGVRRIGESNADISNAFDIRFLIVEPAWSIQKFSERQLPDPLIVEIQDDRILRLQDTLVVHSQMIVDPGGQNALRLRLPIGADWLQCQVEGKSVTPIRILDSSDREFQIPLTYSGLPQVIDASYQVPIENAMGRQPQSETPQKLGDWSVSAVSTSVIQHFRTIRAPVRDVTPVAPAEDVSKRQFALASCLLATVKTSLDQLERETSSNSSGYLQRRLDQYEAYKDRDPLKATSARLRWLSLDEQWAATISATSHRMEFAEMKLLAFQSRSREPDAASLIDGSTPPAIASGDLGVRWQDIFVVSGELNRDQLAQLVDSRSGWPGNQKSMDQFWLRPLLTRLLVAMIAVAVMIVFRPHDRLQQLIGRRWDHAQRTAGWLACLGLFGLAILPPAACVAMVIVAPVLVVAGGWNSKPAVG